MHYFKRYWNEPRADPYDAWGCSWWYFETNNLGVVLRHIEVYDLGPKLRYSDSHRVDEFGCLSEKPLAVAEFAGFEIQKVEFEQVWTD